MIYFFLYSVKSLLLTRIQFTVYFVAYLIFCQSTVTADLLSGSNSFPLHPGPAHFVGCTNFPSTNFWGNVFPHFVHSNVISVINGLISKKSINELLTLIIKDTANSNYSAFNGNKFS